MSVSVPPAAHQDAVSPGVLGKLAAAGIEITLCRSSLDGRPVIEIDTDPDRVPDLHSARCIEHGPAIRVYLNDARIHGVEAARRYCAQCGEELVTDVAGSQGVWTHDPDALGDRAYELNEDHAARPEVTQ